MTGKISLFKRAFPCEGQEEGVSAEGEVSMDKSTE
jgi:hypothetical protein